MMARAIQPSVDPVLVAARAANPPSPEEIAAEASVAEAEQAHAAAMEQFEAAETRLNKLRAARGFSGFSGDIPTAREQSEMQFAEQSVSEAWTAAAAAMEAIGAARVRHSKL